LSYHAGYSRKVTEKLTTSLDMAFGPGNQIVPAFIAMPSFTYKLPYNFSTTNTYRVARYAEQTTQAGIHNLQYTIKPLKTAIGYNLRHSYIENVSTIPVSHLMYITKFYRNNSSVTLSGGLGDAAEFIANANPPRVLEYQRTSVGVRGVHYLTKKSPWGITWGLNYTHYDGLFDSFGYQVGIQRNF
jgi:YaiO family outer membrane protein